MARLKASTMVEPIVAMLIILISLGTAMIIYLNVLSNERLESQTKVHLLLVELLEETKRNNHFINEEIELKGIVIDKKVDQYKDYADAYLLHLQAFDTRERLISELKEIVYVKN